MDRPKILIKTDGVTGTEILINGKRLDGVTGFRFIQSYKENDGLPRLQIDLKATDVTLETKTVPEIPYPYKDFYVSKRELQVTPNDLELPKIDIAGIISDGVQKAVQSAIRGTCVKAEL